MYTLFYITILFFIYFFHYILLNLSMCFLVIIYIAETCVLQCEIFETLHTTNMFFSFCLDSYNVYMPTYDLFSTQVIIHHKCVHSIYTHEDLHNQDDITVMGICSVDFHLTKTVIKSLLGLKKRLKQTLKVHTFSNPSCLAFRPHL